jgi:hypothetical protein
MCHCVVRREAQWFELGRAARFVFGAGIIACLLGAESVKGQ